MKLLIQPGAVQDRRHHFGGSSAHESPISGVTEKLSAHLSADMLHMYSTIMHPAFKEIIRVMHLTCIHVVLVLRTVAYQLTGLDEEDSPGRETLWTLVCFL